MLFSIVAAPVYIPTNSVGGFSFSIPSLVFFVCRFHSYTFIRHCFGLHSDETLLGLSKGLGTNVKGFRCVG